MSLLLLVCLVFVDVSQALVVPMPVRSDRCRVCVSMGFRRAPRRRISSKNTHSTLGSHLERKNTVELPSRIFFTNVRYDVDEEELLKYFEAIGPVKQCKVIRNSYTQDSKGWGFCTYVNALHASTALKSLQGVSINGRPLKLDEATSLAQRRKRAKATEGFEKREARRQRERAALEQQQPKGLNIGHRNTQDAPSEKEGEEKTPTLAE